MLVENDTDKSILNGSRQGIAVGDVGQGVLEQTVKATNGVYITQNMEVHL